MFHGVHGDYRWLETAAHEIYDVLHVCPAVAANKHIVITSFGSGPLQPTPDEYQRGWRVNGRSVHIPVGENVSAIPFEIFDEWYIFSADSPLIDYKVFVKFDWFTLGPAQAVYAGIGLGFAFDVNIEVGDVTGMRAFRVLQTMMLALRIEMSTG